MAIDIYAGKRVLYKHKGQWEVGRISVTPPVINSKGLYLYIVPAEFLEWEEDQVPFLHDAEINHLFLDAQKLDDKWKDYPDMYMTKEEYCNFIERDDFEPRMEQSWFADKDYYYYHINKFTRDWIMKQPLSHVVRST